MEFHCDCIVLSTYNVVLLLIDVFCVWPRTVLGERARVPMTNHTYDNRYLFARIL